MIMDGGFIFLEKNKKPSFELARLAVLKILCSSPIHVLISDLYIPSPHLPVLQNSRVE